MITRTATASFSARNECEAGETVAIRTDGHVLALVEGEPTRVMLKDGKPT